MTMTPSNPREVLLAEMRSILDENPDRLEGDAKTRFDALEAEVQAINTRAEQIATVRFLAAGGRTENGDGAAIGDRNTRTTPIPGMNTGGDP